MSSINTTTFFNSYITNKISKMEDSKMDNYYPSKQRSNTMVPYFISTSKADIQSIPTFISSLSQNKRCQIEELNKLQAEIACVEESIKQLEASKAAKQTKVRVNI